jgi:CBS domain-containing protein
MAISALKVNAGEIMSSPPVVVSESTKLKEAAALMIEHRIGCLPVVNEMGKLTGVVTERTFQVQIAGVRPSSALSPDRRVLEELYIDGPDHMNQVQEGFTASYSLPVSEVMLESPETISRETPLWEVADTMLRTHLSHLVVVLEGKPIGIVARHDLLRAYAVTE